MPGTFVPEVGPDVRIYLVHSVLLNTWLVKNMTNIIQAYTQSQKSIVNSK